MDNNTRLNDARTNLIAELKRSLNFHFRNLSSLLYFLQIRERSQVGFEIYGSQDYGFFFFSYLQPEEVKIGKWKSHIFINLEIKIKKNCLWAMLGHVLTKGTKTKTYLVHVASFISISPCFSSTIIYETYCIRVYQTFDY